MAKLVAEALAADSRVAEARRLLLAALTDHQQRLAGVRAADPQRKGAYEQAIKQFETLRGGSLYYPYLSSGIGRGPLVELADGSVKYDMISGIGVHYFGHSHPDLMLATVDAALRDTVMQGNLEQGIESVALSQTLISAAEGSRLAHCFLTTSGAMANENALKIAFQKKSPANRLLAFTGAFAGRTLALAQITDKAAYRAGLPTVLSVDYIPFFDPHNAKQSADAALATLRRYLDRYPGLHAAMCFELVLGEGGYFPGSREFFVPLMQELKSRGVLVWADEIQTFGRTTRPFAFQHFELSEFVDIATVGKLTQVCATLFSDELVPRPGLMSQTFTAATASILTAQTILGAMLGGDFFGSDGRIARMHRHIVNKLEAMAAAHPQWIRGPFGIGAMIAFTVFDGKDATAKKFLQSLFEAGVIGFIAGANPARVRFLLPVGGIDEADINAVCAILEKTLAQFAAGNPLE
jgi:acetylornithine aminotransferase